MMFFFSLAVKTGDNEIFRKRFKNVLVTFHYNVVRKCFENVYWKHFKNVLKTFYDICQFLNIIMFSEMF